MKITHIILALTACLLWAGNFVAVKVGLNAHMSPLLLTACRFLCASVLLPIIRRPLGISLHGMMVMGLVLGLGQYGLATLSLAMGLSPGSVALLLQSQAIITIALATICLRERVTWRITVGSTIAFFGVIQIFWGGYSGSSYTSICGVVLSILAAASAAINNLLLKSLAGTSNPLSVAVWISPFPILPLLILSLAMEPSPIATLSSANWTVAILATFYSGIVSAVVGTAIWAWLLRRHAVSRVALFSFSIPVFTIILSVIFFGYRVEAHHGTGSVVVILGLLVATLKTSHAATPPDKPASV